jgi:hypothetical protein
MAGKRADILSAQVVLRAADGTAPDPRSVITSQTIDRFRPSPTAADLVRAHLQAAGFEVGPMVGNNFSITGPKRAFETLFGTQLRRSRTRGVESVTADGRRGLELPIDRLPNAVADFVAVVTLTPPPAFGPTRF